MELARSAARPVLLVSAAGRGKYQRTNVDKSGFPRSRLPRQTTFFGFRTGDMVVAKVSAGRKASGTHYGSVAVRQRGVFRVGPADNVPAACCRLLAISDGYRYTLQVATSGGSSPRPKPGDPPPGRMEAEPRHAAGTRWRIE